MEVSNVSLGNADEHLRVTALREASVTLHGSMFRHSPREVLDAARFYYAFLKGEEQETR